MTADVLASSTTSLEAVARAVLPERGLPMSVTAAPFRGPAGKPVVVIATGVRGRPTASAADRTIPPGESPLEPVEILTSAFGDGEKAVEWQRQKFSAALPYEAANALRYESVATLTVGPGTYEVRVATRQERAGLVGSVHTYVDVPDFDNGVMTLSGLVLLDRRAPITTPADILAGILDTPPTTRREFRAGEDVSAFARVYQKVGAQPKSVAVVFRVLDSQLREVASTPVDLAADQFATANSAATSFPLPLDTLKPGAYVLRLDASIDGVTGRRDLRFDVK